MFRTPLISIAFFTGATMFALAAQAATFINTPVPAQTGKFQATFTAKSGAANSDVVIGLSNGAVSGFGQIGLALRFNPMGRLDVRDGSTYKAHSIVGYGYGTTFKVRLVGDISTKKYSVFVIPSSHTTETLLARDVSFRTEQLTISAINNFTHATVTGKVEVSGLSVSSVITAPPPPVPEATPVVTPSPAEDLLGSVLLTKAQIARAKVRYTSKQAPYIASCTSAMAQDKVVARPFKMANLVRDMKYGWCGSNDGVDNSLSDFTKKLQADMGIALSSAYKFVLLNDAAAGARAVEVLELWNRDATIPTLYDFNPDWAKSTFTGMTNDGYCGQRPWNFALDFMWTTYGLRGASEAYLLLQKNGYPLTATNHSNIKNLIRRIAASTDSGLDAWTEPSRIRGSGATYDRYVSDNHIPEALSGLVAAAAALGGSEGTQLFEYAVNGGTFDFGGANNKNNFVSLKKYLDEGLIYEPGTTQVVYQDFEWKKNYRTYHSTVQMALGTLFRTLDLHYPKEKGLYEGYRTPKGFTAMMAAETYALYLRGVVSGGPSDVLADQYLNQVSLELAYSSSTVASTRSSLELGIDAKPNTAKVPRTQYSREFATSTCFNGDDLK